MNAESKVADWLAVSKKNSGEAGWGTPKAVLIGGKLKTAF